MSTFLAVAIGMYLGGLVGHALQPLFWWVGTIVGGVLGWLLTDPLPVFRTFFRELAKKFGDLRGPLRHAFDAVVAFFPQRYRAIRDEKNKQLAFMDFLVSVSMCVWLGFLCSVVIFVIPEKSFSVLDRVVFVFVLAPLAMVAVGAVVCFVMFLCSGELYEKEPDEKGPNQRMSDERTARLWIRYNLYAVFFYDLPRKIVPSLRWFIMTVLPFAANVLYEATLTTIRVTHTHDRTVNMIMAAIGATIGAFLGSTIPLAIAGGIVGIVYAKLFRKKILAAVQMRTA